MSTQLKAELIGTILFVEDMKKTVRFYDEAFGWKKSVDFPVYVSYEIPGGGLSLYEKSASEENLGETCTLPPNGGLTGAELYFYCDDLEEAIRRVEQAGGRLISPLKKRNWGDMAVYYADPGGNVVALASPFPDGLAG